MSNTTFDRWVSAIQKVGLPAVACIAFMWAGWAWGSKVIDAHIRFMETTTNVMHDIAATQKDLAEGQERAITIMESLDRRVGRVEAVSGTSG